MKFFEAIFKGMTSPRRLKKELHLSDSQLNEILEKYDLNHKFALKDLCWKLHQAIDYSVRNIDDTDDLHLLSLETMKYLNGKYPVLAMTEDVTRRFFLAQFKSKEERRAYIELCEGEMKPYNLWNSDDPTLFVHYLIKAVITSSSFPKMKRNPGKIMTILEFVTSKHYSGQQSLIKKELDKLDLFYSKSDVKGWKIDFRGAQFRRKLLLIDTVPYSFGYTRIFTELVEKHRKEIEDLHIYEFFEPYSEEGRQEIEKGSEKNVKQKQEVSLVAEERAQKEQVTVEPVVEVPQSSQAQSLVELEERYQLAVEEIRNLELELQEKKQELTKMKNATIEMIFKKLGNAQSNYLLSDLYRISAGETELSPKMVAGQLMNFFDILEDNFQVKVYGNGYKIGDVFMINREELASTYQAINEITEDTQQLTVELMQYGWLLAGKKIVQPLVKVIKTMEV